MDKYNEHKDLVVIVAEQNHIDFTCRWQKKEQPTYH